MGDLNKSAIADHVPQSNHAGTSVNGVGGGRSTRLKNDIMPGHKPHPLYDCRTAVPDSPQRFTYSFQYY